MDSFLLSESDLKKIVTLVEANVARRINTVGRVGELRAETQEMMVPEVYVAQTPPEGIPALQPMCGTGTGSCFLDPYEVFDLPGYADCMIRRIMEEEDTQQTNNLPSLITTPLTVKRVYNLSTTDVPGNKQILALRDKYGSYIAAVSDSPTTNITTITNFYDVGTATPLIIGCGLKIDVDTLEVDVNSLAGDGLFEDMTGDCPKLSVRLGCGLGLYVPDNSIVLDLTDVVGTGLLWESGTCHLSLKVGCGLLLGENGIEVDVAALIDDRNRSGLYIVTGDCDVISVDNFEDVTNRTTETSDVITGFGMVGGKLRLSYTRKTYNNLRNLAGNYIDRTVASSVSSYYEIDLCSTTECCTGTGTNHGLAATPTADDYSVLIDTAVQLEANASGGSLPYFYQWSFSSTVDYLDGTDEFDADPIVSFPNAEIVTVTLIVTDNCGYSVTETFEIEVTDVGTGTGTGSASDPCTGFPGVGWYCGLGICTFAADCTTWLVIGSPPTKYPDNTCGGAC